jgi:enamine deaminase RidA (YjgF/YER057c/UK114 family)
MGHFKEVVELRRKYFSEPTLPAAFVEIRALYTPEAMIEIEAIAAVPTERGG